MGLFDWLFGKKPENGSSSGTSTQTPPKARKSPQVTPLPSCLNTVMTLLQRAKELPPNDPTQAASLFRELLQASVALPRGMENANELTMAIDSMARHYPEALNQMANDHPDPKVRALAGRIQTERREFQNSSRTANDNLQRWRQAEARAWVELRHGQWNHQDWLELLTRLRQSEFWPMDEAAIGRVLEETKQEWLLRHC